MAWLTGGAAFALWLFALGEPLVPDAEKPSPRPDLSARGGPALEGDTAARTSPLRDGPALPPSLRDTQLEPGLPLGADGRLLPVPEWLELFDYFLAAIGEEPLDVIRARIERHLDAELPPPAAAEARELLARYLAYRDALGELAATELAGLDLERRVQRIRELRREHFGAWAADLFGPEEARLAIDVERRRVALDPALDDEERARRLAALEAELPEPVRETRSAVTAALELRRDEARLRETGASAAEIDALREARFGPDAAARLAALDREREAFDAAIARYRSERDRLLAEPFDGPAEREAALDALRRAHFDGPTLRRVEALDRLGAGPGKALLEAPQ